MDRKKYLKIFHLENTGYVISIRTKWTQLHYSIFWKCKF